MERVRHLLTSPIAATATVLAAGVICWIPSILIHWARHKDFTSIDMMVLTVAMPLLAGGIVSGLHAVFREARIRWLASLGMLFGIWLSGPAMLLFTGTLAQGGGKIPDGDVVLGLTLRFPMATLSLSLYDGSVIGLLVTSVMLLAQHHAHRPTSLRHAGNES